MAIKIRENQLEEIAGLTPEYPYVMHHEDLTITRVPWHWHEELELCRVVSGTVKIETTNQSYVFEKEQGFFINTNILCTMRPVEAGKPTVMDSHLFHATFLSGHFKSIFETKYLEPILTDKNLQILELRGENERQRSMLKKLRQLAYLQKVEDAEFQTRNMLSEIWLLLLEEARERQAVPCQTKLISQERIQTMIAFIQKNYGRKLLLEEIAGAAAVSKRECLRCFQNCIHKTPSEYLLEYRMEMAERLLRTSRATVAEISMETGFSSEAYFCKVFRQIRGRTPGQYRRENARQGRTEESFSYRGI